VGLRHSQPKSNGTCATVAVIGQATTTQHLCDCCEVSASHHTAEAPLPRRMRWLSELRRRRRQRCPSMAGAPLRLAVRWRNNNTVGGINHRCCRL